MTRRKLRHAETYSFTQTLRIVEVDVHNVLLSPVYNEELKFSTTDTFLGNESFVQNILLDKEIIIQFTTFMFFDLGLWQTY